jgi:hypothetical protein
MVQKFEIIGQIKEADDMKKWKWIKWVLVPLGLVLLSSQLVLSAGPAGHLDTIEGELRDVLQENLNRRGYMGNYPDGRDLERGISAYLWDNRNWLKSTDFSKPRNVDALICLMHRQGFPDLETYMDNERLKNWCVEVVLKP